MKIKKILIPILSISTAGIVTIPLANCSTSCNLTEEAWKEACNLIGNKSSNNRNVTIVMSLYGIPACSFLVENEKQCQFIGSGREFYKNDAGTYKKYNSGSWIEVQDLSNTPEWYLLKLCGSDETYKQTSLFNKFNKITSHDAKNRIIEVDYSSDIKKIARINYSVFGGDKIRFDEIQINEYQANFETYKFEIKQYGTTKIESFPNK